MSASKPPAALQIAERWGLTASDSNLIDILHSRASWIWTPEFRIEPPDAPGNEQRAFRKTYTIPPDRSKPTNVTILVAADDYAVMYVNGVLAFPADPTHDDTTLLAFNVPIPVSEGGSTSSLVLGFRVVNRGGRGGLMAAAQVNFEGGETEIFYTGLDQTWLGERLFQEHWEQPWFDSTTQASTWRPADVWSSRIRDPAEPTLLQDEVVVFSRLAQTNGTATELPAVPTQMTENRGLGLSLGGFAGVLIASALLAAAIGAIGSWFFARRKFYSHGLMRRGSGSSYVGVAHEPAFSYEPASSQIPLASNNPPVLYDPMTSYNPPHPPTSYNPSTSYVPPTVNEATLIEPPAYEPVASTGFDEHTPLASQSGACHQRKAETSSAR